MDKRLMKLAGLLKENFDLPDESPFEVVNLRTIPVTIRSAEAAMTSPYVWKYSIVVNPVDKSNSFFSILFVVGYKGEDGRFSFDAGEYISTEDSSYKKFNKEELSQLEDNKYLQKELATHQDMLDIQKRVDANSIKEDFELPDDSPFERDEEMDQYNDLIEDVIEELVDDLELGSQDSVRDNEDEFSEMVYDLIVKYAEVGYTNPMNLLNIDKERVLDRIKELSRGYIREDFELPDESPFEIDIKEYDETLRNVIRRVKREWEGEGRAAIARQWMFSFGEDCYFKLQLDAEMAYNDSREKAQELLDKFSEQQIIKRVEKLMDPNIVYEDFELPDESPFDEIELGVDECLYIELHGFDRSRLWTVEEFKVLKGGGAAVQADREYDHVVDILASEGQLGTEGAKEYVKIYEEADAEGLYEVVNKGYGGGTIKNIYIDGTYSEVKDLLKLLKDKGNKVEFEDITNFLP